jgi:cytoskeleton protein RodZ
VSEIGNTLREARIRKGLTIKDVENVTKIRTRYLEALEQDDFSVLPGPTFVTAFLRSYASYLKLDAESLVEEYKRQHEPRRSDDQIVLRAEPGNHSRPRGGGERTKRRTGRSHRGYILIGVLAVIVIVLLAWFSTNWRGQEAATISSESISSEGTTTSLASVSSTTTEPGSGNSTTTASVVLSGEDVTLVLAVTQDSCWLVVREDSKDGAELYAGTLSQGGQKTFDSSKRYWMRVGKPEVLAITVNGNAVALDAPAGAFLVTEAGIQPTQ